MSEVGNTPANDQKTQDVANTTEAKMGFNLETSSELTESFFSDVYKMFLREKKRSVGKDETDSLKNAVKVVLEMVDFINSLRYNVMQLPDGSDVDSFPVPEELAAMIYPRSIRYEAGNIDCVDVLHRSEFTEYEVNWDHNYSQYRIALSQLRNLSREGLNDRMINVGTKRVDISLSTAWPFAYYYGTDRAAMQSEGGYIGYPLTKKALDLDKAYEYVARPTTLRSMRERYFANIV